MEAPRLRNEALLERAFARFEELPEAARALAAQLSAPAQVAHARRHYRKHLGNARVMAALQGGDAAADAERVIQDALAEGLVTALRRGKPGLEYIEMGLPPTYDCSLVNLGKPSQFDETFHTAEGALKKERRDGTMLEYALKQGKWDCARFWVSACSDQLTLEALRAAKALSAAGDVAAQEDVRAVQERLDFLINAGIDYPTPCLEFGQDDCTLFVEERLKARRFKRPRHESLAEMIGDQLNDDLNESIVGNHGPRSTCRSLVYLVLGATPWSSGLSWHQGCFDDIFPLLERKAEEYQALRSLAGFPAEADPKYSKDADDPNVWIAIFYGRFRLAELMVEMGAPLGVHPNYGCDLLVFADLCIEAWTEEERTGRGTEQEEEEAEEGEGLAERIRQLRELKTWLLDFAQQAAAAAP